MADYFVYFGLVGLVILYAILIWNIITDEVHVYKERK